MTSQAENELLTRVGPGTPMGNLMRQYWIPACLSSELTADGDPLRLMLLGEPLVAFRDTAGRVGILDHRCPHRCAPLFFGRNEEGGLGAASTTAGSSTPTATAWRCRTSRPTRISAKR
jgi:phthalate 4,5-dioxygenase